MSDLTSGEGKQPPDLSCPSKWALVHLSEVAQVQLGKTPGKSDYRNQGECKIVKYRDLNDDGEVVWSKTERGYVDSVRVRAMNLRQLQRNDVLISASAHSSEIIGRKVLHVRQIPDEFKSVFYVGEILCIRAAHAGAPDLPKLLTYFFRSQNGYKTVQAKVHGVHLIASRAEEMVVPIPPAATQARIVSKVDELFSRIEEGERALERVQKLVERYRQSVLKAAVTGELTRAWRHQHKDKLESGEALLQRILKARRAAWEKAELDKMKAKGQKPANDHWKQKYQEPSPHDTTDLPELPEGWVWASVEQVGRTFTGSTPPTANPNLYGGEVPFFKPTDLDQGYAVVDCRQSLTLAGVEHCHLLPALAILVTCIGATIGKVGLARVACATNQQINALVVDDKLLDPRYVYWVFASPHGQAQVIGNSSATTLPILNKSRFESLPFPVPPLSEQAIIADYIEKRIESAAQIAADLGHEQKRSMAFRQAVLKSAFSGELVAQDPTDEPASLLLKRIAAERGAVNTAAKRGRKKKNIA